MKLVHLLFLFTIAASQVELAKADNARALWVVLWILTSQSVLFFRSTFPLAPVVDYDKMSWSSHQLTIHFAFAHSLTHTEAQSLPSPSLSRARNHPSQARACRHRCRLRCRTVAVDWKPSRARLLNLNHPSRAVCRAVCRHRCQRRYRTNWGADLEMIKNKVMFWVGHESEFNITDDWWRTLRDSSLCYVLFWWDIFVTAYLRCCTWNNVNVIKVQICLTKTNGYEV